MALRFTDTDKWKKAWFRKLPAEYKLFWLYLCDNCDHAGMWDVDFEAAEFHIGVRLDSKAILDYFGDKIRVVSDDKWFFEPFIEFQYKCSIDDLNPNNNAHQGVIKVLNKYNLPLNGNAKPLTSPSEDKISPSLAPAKPLTSPCLAPQDKEKDKAFNNNKTSNINTKQSSRFDEIWQKYPNKVKRKEAQRHFKASVLTDEDWKNINLALKKYIAHVQMNSWKEFQNGSTWFNNWQDWIDFQDPGPVKAGLPQSQEDKREGLIRRFNEFCDLCPELTIEDALNSIDLPSEDKVLLKDELNKHGMTIPGG